MIFSKRQREYRCLFKKGNIADSDISGVLRQVDKLNIEMLSENKFKKNFFAIIICYLGFILGFEDGGLQYTLADIADDFVLSDTQMGSLASAQFAGTVVAPLFAGVVSDRIGKKKVILVACAVFAAASGICFSAADSQWLYAGLFFAGLSFAAAETAAVAALSDAYGEKSAKYINLMQGILSFGAVVSPVSMSLAIKSGHADWRFMFALCSVMSLIAGLFFVSVKFIICAGLQESDVTCRNASERKPVFDIVITGVALSIGIYIFMENGAAFFINSICLNMAGSSDIFASVVLSLFWTAMALSRIMCSAAYRYKYKITLICFSGSALVLVVIFFLSEVYIRQHCCSLCSGCFSDLYGLS